MIIQGSMKYSPSGRRRKTNAWKKAKQPNFVAQSKKNFKQGAVAQLGERLPCTEEVAGSTPVSSTKVEEYKAKITKQFDELEEMMNKQMHLTHPEEVEEKMYSINYKWHFISEEDRDFYQGCRHAIEHGLKWA